MISRHNEESESTRVPPEVRAAARAKLDEHGWSAHAYLAACLAAAVADIDKVLAVVGPHRIVKRRGRPRKAETSDD